MLYIKNKRNDFLKETKINKTVLSPNNINIEDYKLYKYDNKIQVVLSDDFNKMKNIEAINNLINDY